MELPLEEGNEQSVPEIRMPQLGESVTEGTLARWLVHIGDHVERFDPVAEVITDKVTAEIVSDAKGVLTDITVHEGDTVKVGTVLGHLHTDQDATDEVENHVENDKSTATSGTKPQETDSHGELLRSTGDVERSANGRYSPAVRKLALEHDIDLSKIPGTGHGGRITRKDVMRFVDQSSVDVPTEREAEEATTNAAPPQDMKAMQDMNTMNTMKTVNRANVSSVSVDMDSDVEWMELGPVRREIARRMAESTQVAPHAWTMVEADVTRLRDLRESHKTAFRMREGVDLTYLPFFIKAVAESLKQFPKLNSSWVDGRIAIYRRIHISIAVGTDEGLAVPVIRDADRLSIAGLAHAIHELAVKARSGRLTVHDVQGGTFTVNNTGAFGSMLSAPILNQPQAAILSMEAIIRRPVVVGDGIAIRSMVNLCLSLDHRVLDGWDVGRFMQAVKRRLEAFGTDTALY